MACLVLQCMVSSHSLNEPNHGRALCTHFLMHERLPNNDIVSGFDAIFGSSANAVERVRAIHQTENGYFKRWRHIA